MERGKLNFHFPSMSECFRSAQFQLSPFSLFSIQYIKKVASVAVVSTLSRESQMEIYQTNEGEGWRWDWRGKSYIGGKSAKKKKNEKNPWHFITTESTHTLGTHHSWPQFCTIEITSLHIMAHLLYIMMRLSWQPARTVVGRRWRCEFDRIRRISLFCLMLSMTLVDNISFFSS